VNSALKTEICMLADVIMIYKSKDGTSKAPLGLQKQ
jgi:hypothetical protein